MPTDVREAVINDYKRYAQDSSYTYDSGLVALPIAGATPAAKVIRLHGGFGTRRLTYDMAREGRPPIVPAMTSTTNDTFLGGSMMTALPTAGQTSQGYNWAVTGEYTFVQLTPRVVGVDTFPVGTYPSSMMPQDLGANAQGGDVGVPPYPAMTLDDWNTMWNGIATDTVDVTSGGWTWPFLAFPPVFSTDLALSN